MIMTELNAWLKNKMIDEWWMNWMIDFRTKGFINELNDSLTNKIKELND